MGTALSPPSYLQGDSIMSTLRTRISPRITPRVSKDAWVILLLAALGLILRFGLLQSIAW
jgi:hypothetical protein